MKNSASNPPTIQALTQNLRMQAVQLLPKLISVLKALGYHEIAHQRISQQNNDQSQYVKATNYQGLTRARHSQFGCVMIKWELNLGSNHELSTLSHEVAILTVFNNSKLTGAQNIPQVIASPILAYETMGVEVLEQYWQLNLFAMSHYEDGSLAQQLSHKKYPLLSDEKKYQMIKQVAHLISNLHKAGWLHNDIKPSNILLDTSFDNALPNSADNSSITPNLLLTDFALAQRITLAYSQLNSAGTPAYLAPERWQGHRATVQSDIYAFGVMMVEILTGKRPFQVSSNSNDKLKAWAIEHCQQPIPKLSSEYSCYQYMVDKALAKRVEKRYRSMEEVLIDLTSLDNR